MCETKVSMGNFKMFLSPKPPSANPMPKTLPRASSASAQTKRRTWQQADGKTSKAKEEEEEWEKGALTLQFQTLFFVISSTCLRSQKVTIFTHPPPPFFFLRFGRTPSHHDLPQIKFVYLEGGGGGGGGAKSRFIKSRFFAHICKE